MSDAKDFAHPTPYASWETRGWWEGAGRGEIGGDIAPPDPLTNYTP